MLESTEIIVQLMRDIIKGKMNLKQTKDKISELEAQYGQDFFPDCEYEEAKPKPWDEEYLHKLEIKSMAGMYSKQFILHLAEVSEDIHSRKSGKSAAKSKEKSAPDKKKPISGGASGKRDNSLIDCLREGVSLLWESLLYLKTKLITLFQKH